MRRLGILIASLMLALPAVAATPSADAEFAAVLDGTKQGVDASLPSSYFLDNSTVVQFTCDDGYGTGFYVGNGEYITARHVVFNTDAKGWPNAHCTVGGKPVQILEAGKGSIDYALVYSSVTQPNRAIVSCAPFEEGQTYFATGYADGNPWTVTQRLIGTTAHLPQRGAGFQDTILRGSTTAGQSGGPVSDNDGLVHGIVSAGPESGESQADIQALADTPYCHR